MKKFRPRRKYEYCADRLEELQILQIQELKKFAFLDCPDETVELLIYDKHPELRDRNIQNLGKLIRNYRSYILREVYENGNLSAN
jgi:hypothetical protein